MINFDDVIKENIKKRNPSWPQTRPQSGNNYCFQRKEKYLRTFTIKKDEISKKMIMVT